MLRHVGDFSRVGSCLSFQDTKPFSRKGAKLAKKFKNSRDILVFLCALCAFARNRLSGQSGMPLTTRVMPSLISSSPKLMSRPSRFPASRR
jgi:hypothetical protein